MQWRLHFLVFLFFAALIVLYCYELYHLAALVFMPLVYIGHEAQGPAWAIAWKDTHSARDRVCDLGMLNFLLALSF